MLANFSTPMAFVSGAVRLRDRKLTGTNGQLNLSGKNEITYDLDVSIDPPAPDKTSVRYFGTMSFEPKQDAPPDGTDVSDFLVVTNSATSSIAGYLKSSTSLGELRRQLASAVANHDPAVN